MTPPTPDDLARLPKRLTPARIRRLMREAAPAAARRLAEMKRLSVLTPERNITLR